MKGNKTMFRDPELPNGFQDADFEMRELEERGNGEARLRRLGRCTHGWRQVGNGRNDVPLGFFKCLHCNKLIKVN